MGHRHAGYGVNERDYETVGEALLWTLEQGLGQSFTPDIREAWAALYRFVADTMREKVIFLLVNYFAGESILQRPRTRVRHS